MATGGSSNGLRPDQADGRGAGRTGGLDVALQEEVVTSMHMELDLWNHLRLGSPVVLYDETLE